MMPNITRGDRMAGLMSYLVGPGKRNEHEDPHLVAGDEALMAWHDDAELDHSAALAIARHLDRPYKAFGVGVMAGVYERQTVGRDDLGQRIVKNVKVGEREAHVWHCSLSLRADEGMQTDEQWNAIANDFVRAMGFDDSDGTKAPCRWVAVRHGVSEDGNDHIHIAVNLVREDGTKASVHNDQPRSQAACRALEVKYGLQELESVRAERATRGYDPAERQAQARARARAKYERTRPVLGDKAPTWEQLPGVDRQARITSELRTDQPRYLLSLKVRGCASAAGDEAEFVRRMRRAGLLVRPRYADGRTDVVTGYSVATRPEAGERPIWYGGGHLARDLTLPRLRDGWPDTPTGAMDAVAEWNAAKRGRRVIAPGRETHEPDPETWDRRNEDLRVLVDRLRSVPLDDRDTWATVARQTSGALAAWSNATEETPGDLAAAAEALSRSAQTHRRTVRPDKAGTVAISGAAMLLASVARGGQGTAAQAVMIRQLLRLTQAVYDAAVAGEQARQARLLAQDTRTRLVRVRDAMPNPARMQAVAQGGSATATIERPAPALDPQAQAMLERLRAGHATQVPPTRSPVPSKIEPTRPGQATKPGAERGPER